MKIPRPKNDEEVPGCGLVSFFLGGGRERSKEKDE